ncbi:DUF397 domain-containing protein [Nocardiopsis mwathae]|uniref:DUF397 domain-containing protein n=1 Tax=Nocardiopsis mwathae TaxID=1472723 RepID=UPI00161550E9
MSDQREWRKSSYSGVNENCVEVAELAGIPAVRDSKTPDSPVLEFPACEWEAFVRSLVRGDLHDRQPH